MMSPLLRNTLSSVLENPTQLKLVFLNQVLLRIIPFNRPHGIKVLSWDKQEVKVRLPYQKANLNHLKTQHACALATAGEYPAGLILLFSFYQEEVRLILKNLRVEYQQQAKYSVRAQSTWTSQEAQAVREGLSTQGKVDVPMQTQLFCEKNNICVATVYTDWQIKKWNLVKTKSGEK